MNSSSSTSLYPSSGIQYENIYESLTLRITLCLICLALMTVGSVLWFVLITFERFGGDPQKRSLSNQLTYYLGFTALLTLNVNAFTHFLRASIGCLSLYLVCFSIMVKRAASFMIAMFLLEILLYKLLQLVIYKRIAALNDDLISVFVLLTNLFLVSIVVFVWVWLGSMDNAYTNLLCCLNTPLEYFPEPNR